MKEVRGEDLDFRRPLTKIKTDCGGVRVVQIFNYVPVPVSLTKLPNISKGTTVHLIIEVLMKADSHHASFAHLPSIGAYEDWKECACLAVRMEWQTPLGWMPNLSAKNQDKTKAPQAPGSYIDTSARLTALKGIVHRTPAPWRRQIRPIRAVFVALLRNIRSQVCVDILLLLPSARGFLQKASAASSFLRIC